MKTCAVLFTILLLSGCGELQDEAGAPSQELCDTLAVTATIGELMGDSLYVFGEITSAEPVPEGVAVLDIHSCRISFFDGDGTYLRHVGGRGEGPGEFLLPIDFAVLEDGRIVVADLVGRNIAVLSQEGELINALPTDNQILPYAMDAVSDSTFFLYCYTTEPFEDEISMGYQVELWNTSGYLRDIWTYREKYDGGEFFFAPGYLECCAGYGGILLAPMTTAAMEISLADPSGSTGVFAEQQGIQVIADSSDTGYNEKFAWVTFTAGGTPVDLEAERLCVRPQVGSNGVDEDQRLWVRRGTTDNEEWLLFSSGGVQTGTGTITGLPTGERMKYAINSHGAVAWSLYPEDYPTLMLLSAE